MKKTSNGAACETVAIGTAGSAVGIKGEFRINLYAEDSDNLKEGKVLLLKRTAKKREQEASRGAQERSGQEKRPDSHTDGITARIKKVRYQNGRPVIRLEGVDDRNAAEELRGMEVSIEAADLEPLPEGVHYVRNLTGCRVIDISRSASACRNGAFEAEERTHAANPGSAADPGAGRTIGILRDVIQNTAQSLLEVETAEGKTVLIPAVDAFLRRIDEDARIIEVELIPGFLD